MEPDRIEVGKKLKRFFVGGARSATAPDVFHKISLVAFLAWIGLGADGISSACYGPGEAFAALHGHYFLAIILAAMTALTVFVISASYMQIIELFPTGGGGYLVASKLLSPTAGAVSGCALVVDYVLTIIVSIAGGADALFSFLPTAWQPYKLTTEVVVLVLLILLNLRGVKESVLPIVPIFMLFLVTHVIAIGAAFVLHLGDIPAIVRGTGADLHSSIGQLGFFGVAVSQVSFINGVARTTSINSLIILATIPINTLIFSILLKKERFSFLKFFAVLVGFFGVFFIVGLKGLSLSGNTVGNLLVLLSSASYSLYLVLSKTALKKHEPFKLLTFVFLFGFLEVLPFSIFNVFAITANPVHIRFWWAPMVVVIVGTLLPNMLTIIALKNVKASVVGVFSYLEPLFGVILSIIILGERLKPNNIIAAALILAGVTIASGEERIVKKLKSVIATRKAAYKQL